MLLFIYPAPAELREKFLSQDLSFLASAEQSSVIATEYYQVDAKWCQNCRELMTLSLRAVTRSRYGGGKEEIRLETVFEDNPVTGETFERVLAARERFGRFVE